jgi:dipeptidyl aminopeptidase/acylaminoacyl peptidase
METIDLTKPTLERIQLMCQRSYRKLATIIPAILLASTLAAGERRPITVRDCVETRRIVEGEVKISPDGSYAAYVVKSPQVVTNRNVYELYVRDMREDKDRDNGKVVLQADLLSGIRWLSEDRIAVRSETNSETKSKSQVTMIKISTDEQEALSFPTQMENYAITVDGDTIVYSSQAATDKKLEIEDEAKQKQQALHGYPIALGRGSGIPTDLTSSKSEVFIRKRTKAGKFGESTKLYFVGPGSLPRRSLLGTPERFDLSPDGKHLLLVLQLDDVPAAWQGQPLIEDFRKLGPAASFVLCLYDLQTEELRLGFDFPGELTSTRWSEDSQAYAVVAPSPFSSAEGKKETADGIVSGNLYWHVVRFSHVFVVDLKNGQTVRVLSRDSQEPGNPAFEQDTPMAWERGNGEMLVRADEQTLVRMTFENGTWKESNRFKLGDGETFGSSISSDGRKVVAIYQSPMISPDLSFSDLKTKETKILTDLNPQFKDIQLGQIESIAWKNKYGSTARGLLIKPVGYEAGKRYPLAILATLPGHEFVSDVGYTTAFAPQSLANAGFLVLFAKYSNGDKEPKSDYPGQMATAYDWMSMIESAIDLLADQGLADKDNVGIVGFSRTSWLTDFMLTHTAYHFAAASSADSGDYTYSGYFFFNDERTMTNYESQIGGPPLGGTLKNWLNFSVPFNAGNVQAPLLMEYTGEIEDAYEFFISLARQGKPVELFRYPNGAHPLDTPLERVASLQRNVDWFRFWMQGYEGKAPDYDTDQYVRWRALRQKWQVKDKGAAKDPAHE